LSRGRFIGFNSLSWIPSSNPIEPDWLCKENNDLIECGYPGSELNSFSDSRKGAALYIVRGGAYTRGNRLHASELGIYLDGKDEFQGAVVEFNQIDNLAGDGIYVDDKIADKVIVNDNIFGAIDF